MTIAAGILAADGVVLASDSATSVVTADGHVSAVLPGGQKIFQLGMNRPYGFVFFGAASFGLQAYRDLLTTFDAQLGEENPPVEVLAHRFLDFAKQSWESSAEKYGFDPEPFPSAGFLIGGCGSEESACSLARVVLRQETDEDESILHLSKPGAFQFEGYPGAACRLVFGCDDATWEKIKQFIPEDKRDEALQRLFEPSQLRAAPTPFLPLRDAIDYIYWIVYSTIKYHKFIGGPQVCGGKVELACITSDRGFRWVTHKSLDWAIGDTEGQTTYSPLDPHRLGR